MDVKRAKVIAYNLIIILAESELYNPNQEDFIDMICTAAGLTRDEYKEIMEV